ncbi:hypothetical protein NYD60_03285 [Burkholderia thailandensis]|uniref:hypothetical protein n=1 Tax=Burkholderia thailandensis TaxID=57975 RepID=UPI00217ED6BD|nr:hypothetical protein [Burkholderia thailandensis]MCS6499032.1 hypothetical protein [Burkholderia thailandensis]
MRTRTFIAAILGFAQPHYMADLSTSAVDLPIATDDHDAAAAPASDTGESSGGASAAPALLSSDTAAAGMPQGDAPEVAASGELSAAPVAVEPTPASATGSADASLNPTASGAALDGADPTPAVSIDIEDHAEARERFAGLLARLHGAEEDFVHALRNELNALGTLLHLHTVASGKADATGDYSSSDLS